MSGRRFKSLDFSNQKTSNRIQRQANYGDGMDGALGVNFGRRAVVAQPQDHMVYASVRQRPTTCALADGGAFTACALRTGANRETPILAQFFVLGAQRPTVAAAFSLNSSPDRM
jgi:hypothetical protein